MASDAVRHVCIVGSGPAGFYAAGYLLDKSSVRVDMIERLPTPFGLVRAGIAPDHQHTKAVTKLFERTSLNDRFRFFGNVCLGPCVGIDALLAHYDAVVLAIGAMDDRVLGIEGERLPGCVSATEFVGWYNGHPDFANLELEPGPAPVVVIGHGNVAADIARIMLSEPGRLSRTDIADHALSKLRSWSAPLVHLVGRRGPAEARFTPPELAELGKIAGVTATVDEAEVRGIEQGASRTSDIFRSFARRGDVSGRELRFHFNLSPESIIGTAKVSGVMFRDPRGSSILIPAGLVIKSIGNVGRPFPELPFDTERLRVENLSGRVCRSGQPVAGLYVVGWAKRGASGTVGTNRPDSEATCSLLLGDLGELPVRPRHPDDLIARLEASGAQLIRFSDWRHIDREEIKAGAGDRPRRKFVRVQEMLDLVGIPQTQ